MKIATLVLTVAVLTGCAIGSPKYSCPAPEHGVCKSISEIYRDQNRENVAPPTAPAKASSPTTAAKKPSESAQSAFQPYPLTGLSPGEPLRREARVLRIWVAPWVDKNGDWNDQSHLYVVQDRGGWRVEESLMGVGRKPEGKGVAEGTRP